MLVITVIRYIVKIYIITCHLEPKLGQFFVRYDRESIVTVIVITQFDCNMSKLMSVILKLYLMEES